MTPPSIIKPFASFSDWLVRFFRPIAPMMRDIYRTKTIVMGRDDVSVPPLLQLNVYANRLSTVSAEAADLLNLVTSSGNFSDSVESWVFSKLAGEGVKTYRPTLRECEALEHVDPRIPVADYRQPFPLLVVEFPKDWRALRTVSGDYNGTTIAEYSLAAIIAHDQENRGLFLNVLLSSGQSLTISIDLKPERTLDEAITTSEDNEIGTVFCTPGDHLLRAAATRIAVNAALLLVEYGCKRRDPLTLAEEKLVRNLSKKNQHNDANRLQLNLYPVVYTFEQHVRLYREESASAGSAPGDSTGRTIATHWRRGHWAMQPYGPARSLRKRIFREAVLVSAELFAGEPADTAVVLTTAKPSRSE